MMTRMGFRPNENYCDGLHVVYLGGKRLAFTHSAGRLADGFPGDVGVSHRNSHHLSPLFRLVFPQIQAYFRAT